MPPSSVGAGWYSAICSPGIAGTVSQKAHLSEGQRNITEDRVEGAQIDTPLPAAQARSRTCDLLSGVYPMMLSEVRTACVPEVPVEGIEVSPS